MFCYNNNSMAQTKLSPLEQEIVNYTGQQAPLPEPPRTFVMECAKSLAQQDGNVANANVWTNNFPSVKLKKGDVISVNSSFLSARGGGDLIQFDKTNNKTRLVFEYYQTNDNTNGKRPSFNIKGNTGETGSWNGFDEFIPTSTQLPMKMNCFPVDYRPMRLYRLMKTFIVENSLNTGNPLGAFFENLPFFDLDTVYPTTLKEPNWGYLTAPQAIVDNVKDTYVPGLERHPSINFQEPHYLTKIPTTGTQFSPPKHPYASI